MQYQFTKLSSNNPKVVSKVFSVDTTQSLKKEVSASVIEADCSIESISNLTEFKAHLQKLGSNQCFIYGIPSDASKKIVTTASWESNGRPDSQIPRAAAYFSWPALGAVLMLDYDAPKLENKKRLSASEILDCLYQVVPELSKTQILSIPSTSSCLYLNDEELAGVKGIRFYVLLNKGKDIERIGEIINTRLWTKSVGDYEVSKSGSLLERSLFDKSVWQTNHIDFCAGAVCHDGIEQRRGEPMLHNPEGSLSLDTSTILDLTPLEKTKAEENKRRVRALWFDFANQQKELWTKEQIAKYSGLDDIKIKTMLHTALEYHELSGDWILTIQNQNNKEETVTVAHVLQNKDNYDRCLALDPLEPDYDGRRFVAKLYLDGPSPNIHSFAHGRSGYKLTNRSLTKIEIVEGKNSDVIDETLNVMRLCPTLFDYGDVLVEIGDDAKIKIIKEQSLSYLLGKLIQFHVRGSNKNPPASVCKPILEINRRLKKLEAIVSAPTLRPDGSILDVKGYDERTGFYLETNDQLVPVPLHPTAEDASRALRHLTEPFKDFPFCDELARSVHLAALLTVVIRPSIPTSPAVAYDAPIQGSGKSLLASCVEVLGSGREPTIWPDIDVRNPDEVRKRAFTAIRSGDRTVIWDNIVGEFDSSALAGILTSSRIKERQLQTQNLIEVPNNTFMVFTGNNFTPLGDMSRRVLVCRIDPESDAPQKRHFDINPKMICQFDRQRLVSAALTLIRFYLSSGEPKDGDTGSFSEWDTFVRQTIMYIGRTIAPDEYVDVAKSIEINQGDDPEKEMLFNLFRTWNDKFKDQWISSSELVDIEWEFGPNSLSSAIAELLAPIRTNAKSLGKKLKRYKGRVVAGMKLEDREGDKNGKLWRIRSVI